MQLADLPELKYNYTDPDERYNIIYRIYGNTLWISAPPPKHPEDSGKALGRQQYSQHNALHEIMKWLSSKKYEIIGTSNDLSGLNGGSTFCEGVFIHFIPPTVIPVKENISF
jgi:hypothetical protein